MTHRLSHSTAPSNAGYSGYMADAGLPRLQQSTTTSNTSGVSTPAASSSDTPELATFYIHSALHRSGQLFHVNKPADIPSSPPVKIRRPKFPETRQLTMCRFPPCVFYVQYPCEQKCRSLGICIHYQFVVSCRKCPDGLRCDLCVASGIEEVCRFTRSRVGREVLSPLRILYKTAPGYLSPFTKPLLFVETIPAKYMKQN